MLPMRSKERERKGPPKVTLGQDADAINEISRILTSISSITLLARPTDSGVAFTTLAHDSLQGCLRRPRVKGLFIAGKAFHSHYWSRRTVQNSIESSSGQECLMVSKCL